MEKGELRVQVETKHRVEQDVTIAGVTTTFVRDEINTQQVECSLRVGNTTYQVVYKIETKVFLNNGIIYGDGSAAQDDILAEVRAAAQELIDWVPEEEVAE